MHIGKSVQIALVRNDMTRSQLSGKAGVTEPYLTRLIKNKLSPKASTIERLANAFDMQVSEFIALGE